jgi:hypothetical protein
MSMSRENPKHSYGSARALPPLTFSHIMSPQFTSPCIPPIDFIAFAQRCAGNFVYSSQDRPACRDFGGEIPCAIDSFKVSDKVSANKIPFSLGFIFNENFLKFQRHDFNVNVREMNFERLPASSSITALFGGKFSVP